MLLVSDEVICAFGRLGHTFGAERYDYLPDIITCAKGLTSGYSPLGAVICRDFLAEPFLDGEGVVRARPHVRRSPGELRGRAREPRRVRPRRRARQRARATRTRCVEQLGAVADLPIVGDLRGAGYFWALELVKDRATHGDRSPARSPTRCCAGSSGPGSSSSGLIARIDDRVRPVVQLAPPLISGPDEFAVMTDRLHTALAEAGDALSSLKASLPAA